MPTRLYPLSPLTLMLFWACGQNPSPTSPPPATGAAWHIVDLPNQEDNVRSDTLVIYTTHDLGDGSFVMAAKRMEDDRDGLRLFLYHPRPDSSAEVLATSAPAYDSWTMLPTFFTTGNRADGLVILANFGEKQSWGQKVFWLKDGQFHDLGFLDVAERGWRMEEDSTYQWRTPIASRVRVNGANGRFTFQFTGDSLQLYDDLAGHQEVMFPASDVEYRTEGGKMTLVVRGEPRTAKQPV